MSPLNLEDVFAWSKLVGNKMPPQDPDDENDDDEDVDEEEDEDEEPAVIREPDEDE